MYGQWRRPNVDPTAFGQAMQQSELYDPTTSAVARTFAEEATIGVGTLKADLTAIDVTEAERTGAPVTKDEYKNSAELFSEGVSWYDGMTRESALISKEFNDAARKRAQIISDSSTSQAVLGFGAGFAAGVVEPKNLAVGVAASLALPVAGTAGFLGKNLQRAYQMRKTAALSQRVGIGAAEGVVAGIAVEPSSRYSAKILQQDYTMMDSLFNVATSAAFGGLLPVAGAGVGKARSFIDEKVAKFKGRTMDVVAQEIDLATTQLEAGQRVDVSAVEAAEIGSITKKPAAEQAAAGERFVRYTESPEFKSRFEGSKVVDADGAPLRVYHGTAKDFDKFDKNAVGKNFSGYSFGQYFSSSPEEASIYARDFANGARPDSGNIRPSYIAAKNPLEIKTDVVNENASKYIDLNKAEIIEKVLKGGHDAVIVTDYKGNKNIVALSPDQIIPAFGDKSLSDIIAQAETANTATLAKAQADALDLKNDTLIDYDLIDAMDERRAIMGVENEAEAEAYFTEAEAEIRQMLDQDILNEADLAEYRSALEELDSRAPIDALETLKLCFTRG
jgi:hypothetical protein